MSEGKPIWWMEDEEFDLVREKTPMPFVDLVILKEGQAGWEVMLFDRQTGPWKGWICTIGGRQRKGEILLGTIARQAAEVGLRVRVAKPFNSSFPSYVDSSLNQDPQFQATTSTIPVLIAGSTPENLKSKEVGRPKWYKVDSLPENIIPHHKTKILITVDRLNEFRRVFTR